MSEPATANRGMNLWRTAMALLLASCSIVVGSSILRRRGMAISVPVQEKHAISVSSARTSRIGGRDDASPAPLALTSSDSDDESKRPWPRIAWLMSFPNSGTSYTLQLVRFATLLKSATNYGKSHVNQTTGESEAVFHDSPSGPFWDRVNRANFSLPDHGYVLTKTHCGGRCVDCGPSEYLETQHLFMKRCLHGSAVRRNDKGELEKVHENYDASLVHKAIHLFRNPFDNIVARFHLANRNAGNNYANDSSGFREFCEQMNEKYIEDAGRVLLGEDVLALVEEVPCHGDFIKYVRWHNMAYTAARNLQIPAMTLHYERYESNFDEVLSSMLDFLEQDQRGPPFKFIAGKSYLEYYSNEEKQSVADMMKLMAYPETWGNIRHYFVEDSAESL